MIQNTIIKKGLIVAVALLFVGTTFCSCTANNTVENQSQPILNKISDNDEGLKIVRIRARFTTESKFRIRCFHIDFLVKNVGPDIIYREQSIPTISLQANLERTRTQERWHGGFIDLLPDIWKSQETKWMYGFGMSEENEKLWKFRIPGFYKLNVSISAIGITRTYNTTIFISMPIVFPKIVSLFDILRWNSMIHGV